jgi:hypothetical protein
VPTFLPFQNVAFQRVSTEQDRGKPDIPLLECDVKDWTLSGADGSSREAKKMVIVVTFRHS